MLKKCRRLFSNLAIGLLLLLTMTCREPGAESVDIGWIGALTGQNAAYGSMVRRGTELAVEEVNAAGGINGRPLRILYEDDQLLPQRGVSALRKLISVDRVPLVIQSVGSTVMLAEAPIAEENQVVLISPTCTHDQITYAGEYIFRVAPRDSDQGKVIAEAILERLSLNTAGILYINNAYGAGLKDHFITSFSAHGGEVLTEEAFAEGQTDFRAQLQRIKESGAVAIALLGYYEEAARILRQTRELGLAVRFIGSDGTSNPELIDLAGDAAEGYMATSFGWDYASDDEQTVAFVTKYQERFGVLPPAFAAYGYDGLHIIATALRQAAGLSGPEIKNALLALEPYQGITGEAQFDELGDVHKPFEIFVVRDGVFRH